MAYPRRGATPGVRGLLQIAAVHQHKCISRSIQTIPKRRCSTFARYQCELQVVAIRNHKKRDTTVGPSCKLIGNLMMTSKRARSVHRRVLAELDDHMLQDIGLTRADVERELRKPLWHPSPGSPSASATSARAASRISCRLRLW